MQLSELEISTYLIRLIYFLYSQLSRMVIFGGTFHVSYTGKETTDQTGQWDICEWQNS